MTTWRTAPPLHKGGGSSGGGGDGTGSAGISVTSFSPYKPSDASGSPSLDPSALSALESQATELKSRLSVSERSLARLRSSRKARDQE